MLPSAHRLRDSDSFRRAVRGGARAGGRLLVVHVSRGPVVGSDDEVMAPRVGFVVSRAVGDAVTRNRVKRRLRHLVGARVGLLPPGSLAVVRALPPAAGAAGAELAAELDRCLTRATQRASAA